MLKDEAPAMWIDQYNNKDNTDAHYKTTGPEIWNQMGGKIDYLFLGVGTGGSITGTAKFLKEKDPNIKVVGNILLLFTLNLFRMHFDERNRPPRVHFGATRDFEHPGQNLQNRGNWTVVHPGGSGPKPGRRVDQNRGQGRVHLREANHQGGRDVHRGELRVGDGGHGPVLEGKRAAGQERLEVGRVTPGA